MSAHAPDPSDRPVDRYPVPIDARHRFFQNARGEFRSDPDALAWETYLRDVGVRMERRDLTFGRFQLYTHRVVGQRWDGLELWCCGPARPRRRRRPRGGRLRGRGDEPRPRHAGQ